MSIIRWSPMWDPMNEMEEMMNRLPALAGQQPTAFMPAMDVYETADAVVVETPLTGVKPENVQVSVGKSVLTIQGESSKEREVDEKNYYRKEVRSGAFYRQIALPAAVQEDKVEAVFEEGLLKITCPKSVQSEVKKIEVRVVKKNNKK